MPELEPEAWEILDVECKEYHIQKIISGNYGSYLSGDSWRVSSAINEIHESLGYYKITTESSTYILHKNRRGMNNIMKGVYEKMQASAETMNMTLKIRTNFDGLEYLWE